MLVKSMAGDFEISIEGFEVEGRNLVMVGKMGVWDARMHVTAREVVSLLAKLFRLRVIVFLLSLPVLLLQSEGKKRNGDQ